MVKKKPSKSEKKQKKQKEGIISPVNSINGGDKDESKKNQVKNNKDSNNLNLDNETTALSDIKISKTKKLDAEDYERELSKLQVELVKLQEWIKHVGMKVVVIFEGRDAAGKGGVIKRIPQRLNPRVCRIVALGPQPIVKKPNGIFNVTFHSFRRQVRWFFLTEAGTIGQESNELWGFARS